MSKVIPLSGQGPLSPRLVDADCYEVLDHGYVRLVESMGDDMSIVRAARVSYNAEPRNDGSDEKLIRYLAKHDHTSPFEHVQLTFEVQAPIFVFRQWHRHRTWSYNEQSARYTELPDLWYVPDPRIVGKQSDHNKQMRELTGENNEDVSRVIDESCKLAHETYKGLVIMGAPRELARGVLPVNTYSRMFASVDLLNLFRFLKLRLHEHAQYEIRVYAEAMRELAYGVCPIAVDALSEHTLK